MKVLLGLCALILAFPSAAAARPATWEPQVRRGDPMGECLLRSTTPEDRAILVKWIFAMVALHPAVQPVVTVPERARASLSRDVAGLMERLLTVSCVAEARAALKNEGPKAFERSFSILGQVAAQDLFASPEVNAGMGAFAQHLDNAKIEAALQPAAK